MNVLIVEDNPIERKALEKLFAMNYPQEAMSVSVAPDGRVARLLLEKSYFDLIMLDVKLPDVNGVDFIDTINSLRPEARIIMVTAYSDYEYLRQSIRKNVFDYILKPYSVDTFRECIDHFMSEHYSQGDHFGTVNTAQQVYQYLRENYNRPISLQDIADEMDMDKSYLGRAFRKEFGYSIIDYMIRLRVDRAESLIRHGMNVSEACLEVGFSDPAYFTRVFKKLRGYKPSEAKKSGKEGG